MSDSVIGFQVLRPVVDRQWWHHGSGPFSGPHRHLGDLGEEIDRNQREIVGFGSRKEKKHHSFIHPTSVAPCHLHISRHYIHINIDSPRLTQWCTHARGLLASRASAGQSMKCGKIILEWHDMKIYEMYANELQMYANVVTQGSSKSKRSTSLNLAAMYSRSFGVSCSTWCFLWVEVFPSCVLHNRKTSQHKRDNETAAYWNETIEKM